MPSNRDSYRHRGWRLPSLRFVLEANAAVLDAAQPRLHDSALVESAVNQPVQSAGGEEAYPGLFTKIAALGFSLARNHGFADGNKRTAFAIMKITLDWNGHYLGWSDDTTIIVMSTVAAGYLNRDGLRLALVIGCGLDPTDPNLA